MLIRFALILILSLLVVGYTSKQSFNACRKAGNTIQTCVLATQ